MQLNSSAMLMRPIRRLSGWLHCGSTTILPGLTRAGDQRRSVALMPSATGSTTRFASATFRALATLRALTYWSVGIGFVSFITTACHCASAPVLRPASARESVQILLQGIDHRLVLAEVSRFGGGRIFFWSVRRGVDLLGARHLQRFQRLARSTLQLFERRCSRGATTEMASPLRPARPVRPIRWI